MLFTIASLAGGFATSQAQLVAARVAQGVGGAIASPTALSLITSTFPEGPRRNKAMGVYAAMSGAGGALGLLLGDILTDLASGRVGRTSVRQWTQLPFKLAVQAPHRCSGRGAVASGRSSSSTTRSR